jgi:hypothetical protein
MSESTGCKSGICLMLLMVIALGVTQVSAKSGLRFDMTPYNLINETTVVFNYTDGSPICMEPACPQNKTYFDHFAW